MSGGNNIKSMMLGLEKMSVKFSDIFQDENGLWGFMALVRVHSPYMVCWGRMALDCPPYENKEDAERQLVLLRLSEPEAEKFMEKVRNGI